MYSLYGHWTWLQRGYPIRTSPGSNVCLTTPRSLSQSTTSFIDFLRQGIHHTPVARFLKLIHFYSVFKVQTLSRLLQSWWSWVDSNHLPFHCKWNVLPGELQPHTNLVKEWWAYQESNLGPQSYQDCALANWAIRPYFGAPDLSLIRP